jgi:predicted PurR-regulated permease PerM
VATTDAAMNLRQIKRALFGLLLIACAFVASIAKDFLVPVIFAFFIALTFRPTIRNLTRRNIPAWAGATVFMSAVVAASIGFVLLLTGPIAEWVANGPQYVAAITAKLEVVRSSLLTLFRISETLAGGAAPTGSTQVPEVQIRDNNVFNYLTTATGYSVGLFAEIALTLVTAAFLMASGDMFYEKLIRVMPTLSDKKQALSIVYEIEHEVSGYLLASTVVNAVLGLVVAAGFYALGMPTPYMWGVLAFALNYVPYLGAVTGIASAALVSLVTFDTLGAALLPPLFYMLANTLGTRSARHGSWATGCK